MRNQVHLQVCWLWTAWIDGEIAAVPQVTYAAIGWLLEREILWDSVSERKCCFWKCLCFSVLLGCSSTLQCPRQTLLPVLDLTCPKVCLCNTKTCPIPMSPAHPIALNTTAYQLQWVYTWRKQSRPTDQSEQHHQITSEVFCVLTGGPERVQAPQQTMHSPRWAQGVAAYPRKVVFQYSIK